MPLPFHRRRLDPDAADFCRRSGATDRAAINAFVKGVKDLGLWDNMVCWPLRSSQNAGFGSTAYSLGGLGATNATLTNGPVWGTNGLIVQRASSQFASASSLITNAPATLMAWATVTGVSTNQDILSVSNPTGQSWMFLRYAGVQAGTPTVAQAGTNSITIAATSSSSLSVNTFAGIAGTYAGNSPMSATHYRNAAADGTASANFTPSGMSRVTMGALTALTDTQFNGYDGTLAAASVLNVALSATQISALHTLYRNTLGAGLGLPDYDPATIEYATRSGATDLANIDAFVRGVKDLGLWDKMVCWPLRSSQNAGNGDTVYSLGGLGTFNGTRVNGPAWGADGMTFNAAATSRVETAFPYAPYRPLILCMILKRGGVDGTTYGVFGGPGNPTYAQLRRVGGAENRWRSDVIGSSGTLNFTSSNSGNDATSNGDLSYVSVHLVSGAFTGTRDGTTWLGPNSGTAGTPASTLSIGVGAANSFPWPSDIAFFAVFESSDFNVANNIRALAKSTLASGLTLP